MANVNAHRIRQAAAEAVVRKLHEGASFDEVARAGEAAADAEYHRLLRQRPGAGAKLVWPVLAVALVAAVLMGVLL